MLTTLMMVGPFILFAWGLQYCLNQIIAEDRKNFNSNRSQSMDDASLT
ncbi:hypothetical protein N836_16020 [Leptolyngbya sp. Heron Island J]|nr:hypothetical protein [Leptolyngbya sp. Heron Island J]ESA34611.1 hypothetical protein N836_16020 [Leptolyngbya sp. Heron Island J]